MQKPFARLLPPLLPNELAKHTTSRTRHDRLRGFKLRHITQEVTATAVIRMKARALVLHVFLPILFGGLIYLCWRDPNLLMFKWFRALGQESLITQLRISTAAIQPALPGWFI